MLSHPLSLSQIQMQICRCKTTRIISLKGFIFFVYKNTMKLIINETASVVCSFITSTCIEFVWRNQLCFLKILTKKVKILIQSSFCVNLLLRFLLIKQFCVLSRKELLEKWSEHSGLTSFYQLLISGHWTHTGGRIKGNNPTAIHMWHLVIRNVLLRVSSQKECISAHLMAKEMKLKCYITSLLPNKLWLILEVWRQEWRNHHFSDGLFWYGFPICYKLTRRSMA